jgi:CheY-like chemotaxis protein
VEDNARLRLLTARSLRARGYEVFDAESGKEAIALWEGLEGRFDLLLTDMVMPEGMTGLELAEKLLAVNPGLKVIISSGYSAEIAEAGLPADSGIIYLPKPVEAQALAAAVRSCLDRGHGGHGPR